jgi:glycosyltransferase involved in cell wall biosynthesis
MTVELAIRTRRPAVSIIIPTRNRKDYLVHTLRLLAEQTYPADDTEVVVVDDGSADGTQEALAQQSYPFRLVCHRIDSAGTVFWAARPRNAGLQRATGALAVLLDSDIFVNAGFVAAHVDLHASCPAGAGPRIGIGDVFGTSQDSEARTAARLQPPSCADLSQFVRVEQRPPSGWTEGRAEYAQAWPELAACPVPWLLFWAGNVSLPRELAVALGGFDEQFRGWGCEDNDLGYRMFREGAEYAWAHDAWGVHYPHPVSPTVEAEARRNCLYLLRKVPDPLVETVLWSVRLAHPLDRPPEPALERWRVEVVREIDQARRAYLAEPRPRISDDLLAAVRAARAPGRPVLWSGPPSHDVPLPPDVVRSDLVGLATPWSDDEFSAAVALDHWTFLSPAQLRAVLRELSRIASRVLLAATGARPVPLALRAELQAAARQRPLDGTGTLWELV